MLPAAAQVSEGAYGGWLCADVVCHELAHQWFGNLATCADWRQLSLNEGFASLMEYKCVEAATATAGAAAPSSGTTAGAEHAGSEQAVLELAGSMSAAALFQRATSPGGERLGIHEGPRSRALQLGADPRLAPIVRAAKADDSDVVVYSKTAAFLNMLEQYMEVSFKSAWWGVLTVSGLGCRAVCTREERGIDDHGMH